MSEQPAAHAVLGPNRYGKAETRVVRISRGGAAETIHDLNVSTALAGDLTASHLTGDNASVLPTDTQKNTVYAFARDGIGSPEEFALRLARHFVSSQAAITAAYVDVESFAWRRLAAHSFRRDGSEVRTVRVEYDEGGTLVASGVRDLVVLNTTDSEFSGFATDQYTTLAPTADRVLATAINARWRCAPGAHDHSDQWDARYALVRESLLAAFADTYSYALQQTLYAMGARVIAEVAEVVEVRLTLPNRHHFPVDLTPFGLDNPNAVYHAADRPYGLIEGTVLRAGTAADPPVLVTMEFLRPADLRDALRLRAERPDAVVLAGGTDVMVELNLGDRRPAALLDLAGLAELCGHTESADTVMLRAGTTFAEIVNGLSAELPALAAASRTVGSPQIRNRATLGGNLGTASPAGDAHPVLLATGARILAWSVRGEREIPVAEFFTGPGRSVLAPDELIAGVDIPRPGPLQTFAKIGTRNAMVIAVCSFALCVDPAARRVGTGIGSAAPTPVRAVEAEEQLAGALDAHGWEPAALPPAAVARFADLVAAAARPIDDQRGTAAYRRHALAVLARRAVGWIAKPLVAGAGGVR